MSLVTRTSSSSSTLRHDYEISKTSEPQQSDFKLILNGIIKQRHGTKLKSLLEIKPRRNKKLMTSKTARNECA